MGVGMTWTLHLPIDLPSANRHGGASTNARHAANAAQYRRQRQSYVNALVSMSAQVGMPCYRRVFYSRAGEAGIIEAERPPVRAIRIVRLWGKGCRAWDDDNMVAACKGIRDACQVARYRYVARGGHVIPGAGLVWDDSAKWSAWTYEQRKSEDGQPGVLLIVEDVPDAITRDPDAFAEGLTRVGAKGRGK